jgi:hypothetical protein
MVLVRLRAASGDRYDSCGNQFVLFGFQAFNICRRSADQFSGAFGDTSQDFSGIWTEGQSSEEIPKGFFLTPTFLNLPSRDTPSPVASMHQLSHVHFGRKLLLLICNRSFPKTGDCGKGPASVRARCKSY